MPLLYADGWSVIPARPLISIVKPQIVFLEIAEGKCGHGLLRRGGKFGYDFRSSQH
jgi:hypothetical protein